MRNITRRGDVMNGLDVAVQKSGIARGDVFRVAYRGFAYFGLASVFGSLLYGFRYDPGASWGNIAFDLALYAGFAVPHLIMTRGWWKRAVWGSAAGSPAERRVYIAVSVVTWLLVIALHRPLPGLAVAAPPAVTFIGAVFFMLSTMAFFQGISFAMVDGLLGVPGSAMSFSHGAETPLLTEGAYAGVRHPMYRAALCVGLSSILLHPHLAQLFWAVLVGGTFVAFIPIEERQLIASRGEAYLEYRRKTPYRLFRGIW